MSFGTFPPTTAASSLLKPTFCSGPSWVSLVLTVNIQRGHAFFMDQTRGVQNADSERGFQPHIVCTMVEF